MRQQRSAWRRYPSVTVHAALIASIVLLVIWADLTTAPEAGANIGAGLLLLVLLMFGLPWSVYLLLEPSDWMADWPLWLAFVVLASPAVLNVLLHLAYDQRQRARP